MTGRICLTVSTFCTFASISTSHGLSATSRSAEYLQGHSEDLIGSLTRQPRDCDSASVEQFKKAFVGIRDAGSIFLTPKKPAALAPGAQGPSYPAAMYAKGIEGVVRAIFVVDTTGRADMATFAVISTTDTLFSANVSKAVQRMRFLAAEDAGRRVPSLVCQSFQFSRERY